MRYKKTNFVSFDGQNIAAGILERPDRYRQLELELDNKYIPRGGGYSYSGASFGQDIISQDMTRFNRILEFNKEKGFIRVEAGITVGELLEWLVQNGMYFPVVPGHPKITLGGCVAADIHGKNPSKDGSISNWINRLTLYHRDKGFLDLTPGSSIFNLTCGGYGLSGTIVDVTLRLISLPSTYFDERRIIVDSFLQSVDVLKAIGNDFEYAYSWHGGGEFGAKVQKGIVFLGKWGEFNKADKYHCPKPAKTLTALTRRYFWASIWNKFTINLSTKLFFWTNRAPSCKRDLFKATFPFAYNNLYHLFFGKKGFIEVQFLIEWGHEIRFTEALNELMGKCSPIITFFSIKLFKGGVESLAIHGDGLIMAINLTSTSRNWYFVENVHALIREFNGQINLSKDSQVYKKMDFGLIRSIDQFRNELNEFDPHKRYSSSLRKILGL